MQVYQQLWGRTQILRFHYRPQITYVDIEVLLQDLIDGYYQWVKVSDNRATGVILVDSILLGFVMISVFVSFDTSKNEISTVKNIVETFLLAAFCFFIIFSFSLAMYSLWGRIKLFRRSGLLKENNRDENKRDEVFLFFGDIVQRYKAIEDTKADQGIEFFQNEFDKYKSKDNVLKALATQRVILSSNLYKRYWALNMSYILAVISFILMSLFISVRFVVN
jgi:hypothetical protein